MLNAPVFVFRRMMTAGIEVIVVYPVILSAGMLFFCRGRSAVTQSLVQLSSSSPAGLAGAGT